MGQKYAYPRLPELLTSPVSFNATGDNIIVAAIASTRLLVHRLVLFNTASCNILIKNGAGTNLTGLLPLGPSGLLVFDISGEPWFTTSLGNAFIINQDSISILTGIVYYNTSQ